MAHRKFRLLTTWILSGLVLLCCLPSSAQSQTPSWNVALPLVKQANMTLGGLQIDLRMEASAQALPYLRDMRPQLVRAGDLDWASIESTQGVLNWEAAAGFENNVRRIRELGLEPSGIIQRSPLWATSIEGRVCAPPNDEALDDLEYFAEQLAQRYSSGDLAVHVWQFGNEVDFRPDQVADFLGSGCWGTAQAPWYGGDRYGLALKRVAAGIRRGNPAAVILLGGLVYYWPDDGSGPGFLQGALTTSAAGAFDAVSYTAYGNWGVNDILVLKALRLREVLQAAGYGGIPLVAAEAGLSCYGPYDCPPDFKAAQTRYAARIYAEALAANVSVVSWYTLLNNGDDAQRHGLLGQSDGILSPHPAYYALRHSAALLQNARPLTPILPLPNDYANALVLAFATPEGQLFVAWSPHGIDQSVTIPIPSGSQVSCIEQLELDTPQQHDCSAQVLNGNLYLSVNAPVYVQVKP